MEAKEKDLEAREAAKRERQESETTLSMDQAKEDKLHCYDHPSGGHWLALPV